MGRQKPTQLNNSVYEFYLPDNGEFNVEVVAFHGLRFSDYRTAYESTWSVQAEGTTRCWLREFIPIEFPSARILSVSYDSCAQVSDETGRMSFSNIGQILVQDIIHLAKVGQRGCPVVLVGYCLGGLVIKQLCTEAEKHCNHALDGSSKGRLEHFLRNVRVIGTIDTPHAGSSLGKYLSDNYSCKGPVLEYLNESSPYLGKLNSEFDASAREWYWKLVSCFYTNVTKVWDSLNLSDAGLVVVEEKSARLPQADLSAMRCDHSEMALNNLGQLSFPSFMEWIHSVREYLAEDSTEGNEVPDHPRSELSKTNTVIADGDRNERPIGEYMYEMYRPEGDVKLEVMFFHGCVHEDSYKSTWMTEDNQDCWLQTWLPNAFPEARILALSYPAFEDDENDIHLTCEALIHGIIQSGRGTSWCPLILVGHCFGGLVIKKLLSMVYEFGSEELQGFLSSVRGIAYYGTSFSGYGSGFSGGTWMSERKCKFAIRDLYDSRVVVRLNSEFMSLTKTFGWKELALGETRPTQQVTRTGTTGLGEILAGSVGRLNSIFKYFINVFGWKKLLWGETRLTQQGSQKIIIVDEVSASHAIHRNSFFPVAADHYSMCKPKSSTSNSFQYLVHFIHTAMKEAQYKNTNVKRRKRRGIAIIISMENNRMGSEADRHRLESMAKYLHFSYVPVVNRNAEELPSVIETILKNEVVDEDECILCCVAAHGAVEHGKQFIFGSEDQDEDEEQGGVGVELLQILKPIADYLLLAGKPKVFVVNCCRVITKETNATTGILPEQNDLHGYDDCLVMYSTQLGKEAWRLEDGYEKGTLFITEVEYHISLLFQTTDVEEILRKVEKKVPEVAKQYYKKEQIPVLYSSLGKRLSWRPS